MFIKCNCRGGGGGGGGGGLGGLTPPSSFNRLKNWFASLVVFGPIYFCASIIASCFILGARSKKKVLTLLCNKL